MKGAERGRARSSIARAVARRDAADRLLPADRRSAAFALSRGFWARFAAIDNVVAIKVAPFNRYRTLDVAFGVAAAGRRGAHHALHRQRRPHRRRPRDAAAWCAPADREVDAALQGRAARPLERLDERRGRRCSSGSMARSSAGADPAGDPGARCLRHRLQRRRLRRRQRFRRLHPGLPRDPAPPGADDLDPMPRSRRDA